MYIFVVIRNKVVPSQIETYAQSKGIMTIVFKNSSLSSPIQIEKTWLR